MTTEAVLGFNFLATTLQGDSTLASLAPGGVFRGTADPQVPTPYVIVALQSGTDSITNAGVRTMSELLFQIKAVGPAKDAVSVASAYAQVDSLLGGERGLRNVGIPNGFIGCCYRDGSIVQDELVTGQKWINIGGMYRVTVEQTS